jgi:hypothetical protein
MRNQPHTVPSLSGTLAKHTKPTLKPNFAKEPSSPSRSIAMTKKHCSKIEIFELTERKQPAYNKMYKSLGSRWLN